MPKKTWNKTKTIVTDVGKCRYCNDDLISTDSFVAFLSTDIYGNREKAHYQCMKDDDAKRSEDKTYE